MRPECIAEIQRAAGRTLLKGEIDGIDARIRTALRDLSVQREPEFLAMTPAQRIQEAAKLAKERMLQDVVASHETEIRNASIRADLDNFRESFEPGKSGRLLASIQRVFFDAGSRIRNTSVEMNRTGIMRDFMRQLEGAAGADNGKFMGFLQDATKRNAIIKELFNESSGDAEAAMIAKSFRDTNKFALDRMERAGIGVHELDNWNAPQNADWIKVAGDQKRWVDQHLEWVDRRAYVNPDGTRMDDAQLRQFLEKAWETQATNGAYKAAESEGVGSGLGTSRRQPRQIHYKDSASYIAAMEQYGRANNVYSMFMQHFNGIARDVAVAETLGSTPHENFKYLVEKSFGDDVKAAKSPEELASLKSMKEGAYRMFDALTKGESMGNQLWALRMAGVRSVISSSMLGNIASALGDFASLGMTAKMNGLPAFRTMRQTFSSMASKSDREMLGRLGLGADAMQAAMHRYGLEELGAGAPAMLNTAVHHLSGLAAMDRGQRGGLGIMMMDLFGKLTRDKSLADLAGGDHDFLVNSKGVTETNWKVWQAADVDTGPSGDRTILGPQAIYDIAPDKIKPIVQEAIASRSEIYRNEVARLQERRAKELGWLDSRVAKFSELRQRAADIIGKYAGTREKNLSELRTAIDARAEVTRARVEAAEVEHDIAGYLKTDKTQDRVSAFLKAVEDGASVERKVIRQRVHPDNMTDAVVENFQKTPSIGERADSAVENYGREINRAAEALGARRARAEAKLAEAEKQYAKLAKEAETEVSAKIADYEKRLGKRETELADYAVEMRDRLARYGEYENAFQDKFGKIEAEEIERAKSDAATKLLAATHSELQIGARGATGASLMEKDALGLLQRPAGTVAGEIWRMVMLMKQTPFGVAYNHLFKRAAMFDDWQSRWSYRARFMFYSTLIGSLAVQLKAMATGENPEKMNGPGFWMKSAVSGGGFGIYGDLLFADGAHTTNSIAGILGGPGLSMAEDAYRIYQNAQKDLAENGQYKYGSKFLEFARKYATPLGNIWYTKAAFNHLIYHEMQEGLDPGWSARLQNKMVTKHDTRYWWSPGPHGPQSAPDFSTAIR